MADVPRIPPPAYRYPMPSMYPGNPQKSKMPFNPTLPIHNLSKNQGIPQQKLNMKHPNPPPGYYPPPPYPHPYGMYNMPNMHQPPYGYYPRMPNMPNMLNMPNIPYMPNNSENCNLKKGMIPPPPPHLGMVPRQFFPPKNFYPKPQSNHLQQTEKSKQKQIQKQKQKLSVEQSAPKTLQIKKDIEYKPKGNVKIQQVKQVEKKSEKKKNYLVEPFQSTKKIKKQPKLQIPTSGRQTRKKKYFPDQIFSRLMKDKGPRDFIMKIGKEHQATTPSSFLNQQQYFMKQILPKKQSLLKRLVQAKP